MTIATDIFAEAQITLDLPADNKREALKSLTQLLALDVNVHESAIFAAINERETLGTTGIGQGLAIPHARVEGVDRVVGILARLAQPVDYDSVDGKGVDVIFMLVAPLDAGSDHLRALASASRLLRDPAVASLCRQAKSAEGLRHALAPAEMMKLARAAE